MKPDAELQKDVQDAIQWEPLLHAAEIGVTVKDGIVTLTGTVDSYSKKMEAEDAAKNVAGVIAVVEKIEVKYFSSLAKMDDNEIAAEVVNAFKYNLQVPSEKLKVKVEKGWVTLGGEAQWNYQREAAKDTIKNLLGVMGVTNNIEIKSETEAQIEKTDIENAIKRNYFINNKNIAVEVSGHDATLTGKVDSLHQKKEAERMAWNAPGVSAVHNELVVEYK
jgi:osmotically-inducible protein OsmY